VSVTPSFRAFALEQLARVVPGGEPALRARAMFGGVGVYAGERFFALLDDDVLYLKVDDETRAEFEGAGMRPFMPGGDPAQTMQYYDVPAEVLEDADALRPWVGRALEAAARKSRRGPKRK
jgi:DNA transformation protein